MCSTARASASKARWIESARTRGRDHRHARARALPLRWRAAEGAGERRGDVGRGYNLFGRFFGWHFFVRRRSNAGRRINQATVLDNLFKLRAVEGFKFQERLCDCLEFVAIRSERCLGQLIRVIE